MNHASVFSSTVPVLPASGHSMLDAGFGGAALDDALEQAGHHERRVGADDVDRLDAAFLEQVALAVGDGLDEVRLDADAAVREHGSRRS